MTGLIYRIEDSRFRSLILPSTPLRRLSQGHLWTEGPVWFPAHQCLLFSDIPNQRMHRWTPDGTVSVFRDGSAFANGNARDGQGRLLTCQHETRSVTRTEHDGSTTVIADCFEGRRLNSPNDVIVKSDGTIWFTDPTYGILSDYEGNKAPSEQPANHVFCYDERVQSLAAATGDLAQPNGLAFSPDESVLYVADSANSHDPGASPDIVAFDLHADNTLGKSRLFATIPCGFPDGMCVDRSGNLWSSAGDGVYCFDPDGRLLGAVDVPETVSNVTFGGPRRNTLFITATSSVYGVFVNVEGSV